MLSVKFLWTNVLEVYTCQKFLSALTRSIATLSLFTGLLLHVQKARSTVMLRIATQASVKKVTSSCNTNSTGKLIRELQGASAVTASVQMMSATTSTGAGVQHRHLSKQLLSQTFFCLLEFIQTPLLWHWQF